jgi:hypothetical protein
MSDQLITVLLGAAIGGMLALVGVFVSNRSSETRLKFQTEHDSRQKKRDLLLERGEELYVLTDKWLNYLFGHSLNILSVMQGKLTYNQCLDLEIEAGKNISMNFARIQLLIDIYFPSSRKAYDTILEERDKINTIEASHKRAYKKGDIDGISFLRDYLEIQNSLEKAGAVFKNQLIECIRTI